MTTPFRRSARCECGRQYPLEDALSQWIRNHSELRSSDGFAFSDADMICHRFKTDHGRSAQYLMLVEFKTMSRPLPESQRDTLAILDQALRNDRTTPTKVKQNRFHMQSVRERIYSTMRRSLIRVIARGVHVVTMDGPDPDSSSSIFWNDYLVTKDQLVSLLRFDLDPDTLRPVDLRKHHRSRPKQTSLFDEYGT